MHFIAYKIAKQIRAVVAKEWKSKGTNKNYADRDVLILIYIQHNHSQPHVLCNSTTDST